METATMKSDGERMRSAVTALRHAQKRLVPMDDDPIQCGDHRVQCPGAGSRVPDASNAR
jgi:hypothetical protein